LARQPDNKASSRELQRAEKLLDEVRDILFKTRPWLKFYGSVPPNG